MRVHVFGNRPSPTVAMYGLRRVAQHGEAEFGADAKDFVQRDFYFDDGLKSLPSITEAIDLLKAIQDMLAISNLKLHKIASNSPTAMQAFPSADYAKDLKDLDLEIDSPPVQHSLGLSWNLQNDTFTFHVASSDKPFTHRGILATVNSLFDPLGLVAPISIQGKLGNSCSDSLQARLWTGMLLSPLKRRPNGMPGETRYKISYSLKLHEHTQ